MSSFASPIRRQLLTTLPILLVLTVFYAFMASAGRFQDLHLLRGYDVMSDGFRSGHLYLAIEPPAALLAKANPFDHAHKRLWFYDASLYDGHFYLYWGPVPALLLWLFRAATGYAAPITDQWLTMAFMLGRLYAGTALIVGLCRFVRTRQPPWVVNMAVLLFGLTSPIPFIVARPLIYEACLAAGQCFLFCGLAAAFRGVTRPSRPVLWFGIAGLSWALAIGSRVTMVIPVPFLIAATAGIVWWRSDRSLRTLATNASALGIPVAMALAAYAFYNHARFGSVTEFGVAHQLTTQEFYTSKAFILPNIFSYLFAPVDWSCGFPFVRALRFRALSPLITWPEGYKTFELVAGILVTSGWCWLVLVAAWRALAGAWFGLSRRGLSPVSTISTPELWAALCSVAILGSLWPVLGLWEASMRYPGDAIGGLVILTTVSALWLLRRADRSARRSPGIAVRGLLIALALHSCVVGALSGVASYNNPFNQHNPVLYAQLGTVLSFCPAKP